jgi:hypothetical protein
MKSHLEAVTQLYQPSTESLRVNLPNMGKSLDTACCELARDLSLVRLDRLAAQLNSAQSSLQHLRKALIAERGGVQRGGCLIEKQKAGVNRPLCINQSSNRNHDETILHHPQTQLQIFTAARIFIRVVLLR